MPLSVITIPCLDDNYAYLIHDAASGATAVVDVPDADPILSSLQARHWTLSDIWITHHHHDHIGDVDALRKATGARVTGARADDHRLPNLDTGVDPGDRFDFGGETVEVLDVSGHTVGHVAYSIPGAKLAFTGDSLMALGCGRLFEGTPERMWESLSRLTALDPATVICSGHEYSQSNARFALSIDADNADLRARAAEIDEKRKKGEATVPVTLDLEQRTNPFLRAGLPSLKLAVGLQDAPDTEVFAEIRRRKDSF